MSIGNPISCRHLLLVVGFSVFGCANTQYAYVFVSDGHDTKLPIRIQVTSEEVSQDGYVSNVGFSTTIINSSTTSATLSYARSSIVDHEGVAHGVVASNQKFIEAEKPLAESIVPPRARLVTFLAPADHVRWVAPTEVEAIFERKSKLAHWEHAPLLPRSGKEELIRRLGGALFRLRLFVQHSGLSNPEVEIGIRVAKIVRLSCKRPYHDDLCTPDGVVWEEADDSLGSRNGEEPPDVVPRKKPPTAPDDRLRD